MSLNDDQTADLMEHLVDKINSGISELGFEFRPDADAEEIEDVPDGEAPYTYGQSMIEEFAGKLSDLLQEKS